MAALPFKAHANYGTLSIDFKDEYQISMLNRYCIQMINDWGNFWLELFKELIR